ncbi:probable cytochrome P450 304a1 [Schistocerca americana]|uniref:probable cytochrome P450 304a1 n=1 Tax=Schistocerca americana TaxID=7009 RepID=UPI001F4F8D9C|nr:probable cytochrome P450 304a1 [Schistocerca americana]
MALVGVLLAALAVGLLLYMMLVAFSRPDNFPPGPPPMPIWGNYVQMLLVNYKHPYKMLDLMTRFYKSKVIGFFLGESPTIVACDYQSVKEVLNNPHLQGRPVNIALKHRMFNKELGIFFTEGPHWLEQKRFSLRNMRDFGFGRRSERLEAEIAAELRDLVELIRGGREDQVRLSILAVCLSSCPATQLGPSATTLVEAQSISSWTLTFPALLEAGVVRPSSGALSVLLPDVLLPVFVNALLSVYTGARLPRSADATVRHLGHAAMQFQRSSDATGGFLTLHPWLAWLAPRLSGYKDNIQGSEKMRLFLEQHIEEHKQTYSDDYMRDFIDSYLREIGERGKTGEPTMFTSEQLSLILLDFFFPTASSLPATLTWALLFTSHHLGVQKKVQDELDAVVGRGRLPTLDDRPNLPYTEATLREAMRIRTLTPLSVFHKATEDTTLQGYSVPRGAIVITCLYSMHMDGDLWGDPNTFRPERFLDSDGKLIKKDFTLPFGAGKRLCAGETFSKQNLFLTFSTLLQNFSIKSDGVPSADSSVPGVIETAPTFWAQFVPR